MFLERGGERGLLDSMLSANETLEEINRKNKSSVCLKVDYEKAYYLIQ